MEAEPSEELIKEVFAHFGLAYYHSECLHRGLCICYAAGPFVDKSHATRPYYEERLAFAFSLTLGKLSAAIKEFLPDDIHSQIEKACEQRNFLAHHFWYERCHMLYSEKGISEVLKELFDMSSTFEKLDKIVQDINDDRMANFGISEEQIEYIKEKMISGELVDPLINNRFVKKLERIINIWKVPIKDEGPSLLFQTEDGMLLQLCADGLGWSHLDKPSNNWEIDQKFKQYLPANVETRPIKERPWDYELRFSTGILLWVKMGSKEKKFVCGIKKLGV